MSSTIKKEPNNDSSAYPESEPTEMGIFDQPIQAIQHIIDNSQGTMKKFLEPIKNTLEVLQDHHADLLHEKDEHVLSLRVQVISMKKTMRKDLVDLTEMKEELSAVKEELYWSEVRVDGKEKKIERLQQDIAFMKGAHAAEIARMAGDIVALEASKETLEDENKHLSKYARWMEVEGPKWEAEQKRLQTEITDSRTREYRTCGCGVGETRMGTMDTSQNIRGNLDSGGPSRRK